MRAGISRGFSRAGTALAEGRAVVGGALRTAGSGLSRAGGAIIRWAGPIGTIIWGIQIGRAMERGDDAFGRVDPSTLPVGSRVRDMRRGEGTIRPDGSGGTQIIWDGGGTTPIIPTSS